MRAKSNDLLKAIGFGIIGHNTRLGLMHKTRIIHYTSMAAHPAYKPARLNWFWLEFVYYMDLAVAASNTHGIFSLMCFVGDTHKFGRNEMCQAHIYAIASHEIISSEWIWHILNQFHILCTLST